MCDGIFHKCHKPIISQIGRKVNGANAYATKITPVIGGDFMFPVFIDFDG